jgi:ABC-type uncharacterized transport system YnjBCD permease subunit
LFSSTLFSARSLSLLLLLLLEEKHHRRREQQEAIELNLYSPYYTVYTGRYLLLFNVVVDGEPLNLWILFLSLQFLIK